MASTLSSTTIPLKINHDVFLSFRGPDTRANFTSHLYATLCQKNIITFIDDSLDKGEEISRTLLKAIEESKMSLIIFSENYASSRWCLDELEKIMECVKTMGRKVLPVFYHVNPSDVRHQIGNFGEAFGELKEKFKKSKDKVEKWSTALREAANKSGWDSNNYRDEAELIEIVVKEIMKKLHPISFSASADLAGIDSHIQKILTLLCIGSSDIRFVGIWGMGGIGKTTIAEALISQISCQFDVCCFLGNVSENSEKYGLRHLRQCFLSKLLQGETLSIEMIHTLPTFVIDMLSRKKVIIVLDDVNNFNQLEALVGDRHWFGPGSRVIVTSRDKEVLNNSVDEIYKVNGLNYCDSLQLLCMKAFKQKCPPKDFIELSKRAVYYANGVPLALKVLGSHLCKRSPKEWESALNKLKQCPDSHIQKVLETSYDELDPMEKEIFLDVACFFKGNNKDYVEDILDGCGFTAKWGLIRLMDKCLIDVVDNILEMHDLIQDIGQDIARRKGSRLWKSEDIYHLLTTNKEKKKVEGILLDISKSRKLQLNPAAFSLMPDLRILKFYRPWCSPWNKNIFIVESAQSNYLECLPNELSLLHWEEYPYKSLPSNFLMENLVKLNLQRSKVEQLWNGDKCPEKLKTLDLSYSKHLLRLPNLSSATNLELICLRRCESLVEIASSIQNLHKLTCLLLEGCKKLTFLPSLIQLKSLKTLNICFCSNLKMLPEIPTCLTLLKLQFSGLEEWSPSVLLLSNLRSLNITDCKNLKYLPTKIHLDLAFHLQLSRCQNISKFPDIIGNQLGTLIIDGTEIETLPSSIGHLSALTYLGVVNCRRLWRLPSNICELKCLKELILSGCSKLCLLPPLRGLCSLYKLYLDGTGLVRIPGDIDSLSSLSILHLNNCKRLQSATSTSSVPPIKFLKQPWVKAYEFSFCNCLNLDQNARCNIMANAHMRIKELATSSRILGQRDKEISWKFSVGLPGSEIPEWFSYESAGSSIDIVFSQGCFNSMFVGFAFAFSMDIVFPQGCYESTGSSTDIEVPKFCVIYPSDHLDFNCFCTFKNGNGDYKHEFSYCNIAHPKEVLVSHHVFLWSKKNHTSDSLINWLKQNNWNVNEASFIFKLYYVSSSSRTMKLEVKKCGIHLVYANDDLQFKCKPINLNLLK